MSFQVSSTQKQTLDRILSESVSSKSTPAVFFGATNVEGPIYMHTEGTKLVDDLSSGAIDEDTVFWFCSQTKLITTIAALQLVEQGKIALDTPVETILPELANPVVVTEKDEAGRIKTTTPAKEKITFGQLLDHTSGLDYQVDAASRKRTGSVGAAGLGVVYIHHYKEGEGASKFFELLKGPHSGIPLGFEPGTNFAYGFSSDCAGFIVERISGKSLEQYFQENIFAPLGIKSMSFSLRPELEKRLLPLTFRHEDGSLERWKGPDVVEQDRTNVTVNLGGAGLYGSQKDYLTILRHLLQIKAGTATNPILSRTTVDSMFTPSLPPTGANTISAMINMFQPSLGFPKGSAQFGYGLCLNTADIPGKRRKGSGYWGGWANTTYFVDPAAGVAAVFGTQLVPTGDRIFDAKMDELERALYVEL
ncbi:beta-lactamase/transpeptidase-like protein [Favolaschia claudopus]|uniref:Beta-lactamase/transpeptidase-like protein n=1 Tax=Favolaschia claudopus TaxID=2862362 RepID=A0AAW0C4E4_9AGAR